MKMQPTMLFKLVLCTGLLWAVSATELPAQRDAERKEQARKYMSYGKFSTALTTLRGSHTLIRDDQEAKMLAAILHYEVNELEAAERLLYELMPDGQPVFPECHFYLGRIHHARHQFAEAAQQYKSYMRSLRADTPERERIVEDIKRCDNGQRLQFQPTRTVVENLGRRINTAGDEFAPIPSPTSGRKLYFTAAREGNSGGLRDSNGGLDPVLGQPTADMFTTELQGTEWQNAQPMHFLLNSPRHEMLLDFSRDGRILYYFQGVSATDGMVLTDTFQRLENRRLITSPADLPVYPAQGDGTPYLFNDTLLLFSSSRAGGYGGLDLYRSRRTPGGRWSTPENLGPVINSAYDETTPFLARDGRTLYFSTNDSRISIGGFDIVKSYYLPTENRWTAREHPGIPLNSAGDDTFFRLAEDGFTGFLSSDRKEGYGLSDIYVAWFQDFQQEMEPPLATTAMPPASTPEAMSAAPAPTAVPVATQPAAAKPATTPAPAAMRTWMLAFGSKALPGDGPTRQRLQQAMDALQQYPHVRLVITGYSTNAAFGNLFEAMERAGKTAEYLQERGIDNHRIYLRAVVDQGGRPRVGLTLADWTDGADPDYPVIGYPLPADYPGGLNQEFYYKVQFISTRSRYEGAVMENYDHPMIESVPGLGYYRYTLGSFGTYAEAKAFRQQLIDNGMKGPFIVAYRQGVRMSRSDIEREADRYADFREFLHQTQ